MTTKYSYAYEELFEDIPGDKEHVSFIVPAEILDLAMGEILDVKVEKGVVIIEIT